MRLIVNLDRPHHRLLSFVPAAPDAAQNAPSRPFRRRFAMMLRCTSLPIRPPCDIARDGVLITSKKHSTVAYQPGQRR